MSFRLRARLNCSVALNVRRWVTNEAVMLFPCRLCWKKSLCCYVKDIITKWQSVYTIWQARSFSNKHLKDVYLDHIWGCPISNQRANLNALLICTYYESNASIYLCLNSYFHEQHNTDLHFNELCSHASYSIQLLSELRVYRLCCVCIDRESRCQWPRGLRRGSAVARFLGL
jgi:hypothetical protein